jgi:hypothetical protein
MNRDVWMLLGEQLELGDSRYVRNKKMDNLKIRSENLWLLYISKIIEFLDIINRKIFHLKTVFIPKHN